MFEAIVALCLAAAPDQCRETLLPGFEAPDKVSCEAALAARPPDITAQFAGLAPRGAPICRPLGPQLDFTQVADGVFVHRGLIAEPDRANAGDVSNIGFVIGDNAVVVIDTGTARWMGEATWRAIRARTDKPVSRVILTHMHPDHVLGASVFTDMGAQVVAHANLDRALADRRQNYLESLGILIGPALIGTSAPDTDAAVSSSARIDIGNRWLTLHAWPRAHTGTDLTVLDEATGVLFTGDLVFDDHVPALDGSLRGWQAVLADMADLDITQIVPGHGGPLLDWPVGAAPMQRYLDVLAHDTRKALSEGQRMGEAVQIIAESERAHWHLFDAFNPRNATVAFTELEWE